MAIGGFFDQSSYAPLVGPLFERGECESSVSSATTSMTSMDTLPTWTPETFKKAVVDGNPDLVQAMIRNKADVNQTYQCGLTPMHFAAIHNQVGVARVLKDSGANCLAETTDEQAVTAGAIAYLAGHKEVVDIICEEAPDVPDEVQSSPVRRFLPPLIIAVLAGVDTIFGIILVNPETRWDGFIDDSPAIGDSQWFLLLALTLDAISLSLLVFVHFLDPGGVERSEVAFVQQLRDLPEDQIFVLGDDSFSVLKDGDVDPKHTYRWCRSCELWRPPSVSHCNECKRCFWRFDHHCIMVNNCVALRNHRYFVLALITGSAAWILGDVAVLSRVLAHADLSSTDAWWPPRPGLASLHGAFAYLLYGLLVLTLLVPFTLFHTGSMLGNYTTKSVWKPTMHQEKKRFNNSAEMRELCCLPVRFRGRGRASDPQNLSLQSRMASILGELS